MSQIISYIGSKVNLYPFLEEVMFSKFDLEVNYNFYDLFSGSNAVSYYVDQHTKWNIYANDLSNYSSDLFYYILFNKVTPCTLELVEKHLQIIDSLPLIENGDIFNEFSYNGTPKTIDKEHIKKFFGTQEVKSRLFFSEQVGKKLDTIKHYLYENFCCFSANEQVFRILKIFMLNYADKNRNTTGVYGAYLKNTTTLRFNNEKPFLNKNLLNHLIISNEHEDFLDDTFNTHFSTSNLNIINVLQKFINQPKVVPSQNIIYLDPPYNSRSYESNYHILNYLSNMHFSRYDIKQNSKSALPNVRYDNPFNSKIKTHTIFKDMITLSVELSDNVFISYNTEGTMTQKDIEEIVYNINPKLVLNTHMKPYKKYKSNITTTIEGNSLQEIIWHIYNPSSLKVEK